MFNLLFIKILNNILKSTLLPPEPEIEVSYRQSGHLSYVKTLPVQSKIFKRGPFPLSPLEHINFR